MKQLSKNRKLKKGDKIKVNNEEYFADGFNESMGEDSRVKEIVLSKKNSGSKKFLKETYKINVNKKSKSVSLAKISEKNEKSKDGFSYEKNVAMVSYSENEDYGDNESDEIEYEINDSEDEF